MAQSSRIAGKIKYHNQESNPQQVAYIIKSTSNITIALDGLPWIYGNNLYIIERRPRQKWELFDRRTGELGIRFCITTDQTKQTKSRPGRIRPIGPQTVQTVSLVRTQDRTW